MKMTINEKMVFSVKVLTRHIFSDWFQSFKNLIGMNLKSYEELLAEAIEQAVFELHKCYPDVYDIQIVSPFITQGTASIIVYGKIKI